jgi:hypothetical protein
MSIKNRVHSSGVPTWFAVILTLKADEDDLYSYTIFTRGVPERVGACNLGDTSMIEITRKDMGA